MHLSNKGTGMDIHTYLNEWHSMEPKRSTFVGGDRWTFHFGSLSTPPVEYPPALTCDVITVHGVGVIEDLIKACIKERDGWRFDLLFDREEEVFSGQVTDSKNSQYTGLESLNPGIALLTAYLNTLREQTTT